MAAEIVIDRAIMFNGCKYKENDIVSVKYDNETYTGRIGKVYNNVFNLDISSQYNNNLMIIRADHVKSISKAR